MIRGLIPWICAGIVTGGILHILTIISIPWLAKKDAWTRLSAELPLNKLFISDGKTNQLPFSAPDVVHAYCLFDLSERNIVVTSQLLDNPWSIAVSSRAGENFYVITGADAKKSAIRIIIIPRDRLAQEASTEKTDEGEDQNIIVSPTTKGIVVIRAPLRGESFRAQTLQLLSQARCDIQKPPEALIAEAQTGPSEATATPQSRLKRDRRRRRR